MKSDVKFDALLIVCVAGVFEHFKSWEHHNDECMNASGFLQTLGCNVLCVHQQFSSELPPIENWEGIVGDFYGADFFYSFIVEEEDTNYPALD